MEANRGLFFSLRIAHGKEIRAAILFWDESLSRVLSLAQTELDESVGEALKKYIPTPQAPPPEILIQLMLDRTQAPIYPWSPQGRAIIENHYSASTSKFYKWRN